MEFIAKIRNDDISIFSIRDTDIVNYGVVNSGSYHYEIKFHIIVSRQNRHYLEFLKSQCCETFDISINHSYFKNCHILKIIETVSRFSESLEVEFSVSAEQIIHDNAVRDLCSGPIQGSKNKQHQNSSKIDEACKAIEEFMRSS